METRRIIFILMTVISAVLAACTSAVRSPAIATIIPTDIPAGIQAEIPGKVIALDNAPQNVTYFIDGEAVTLINGVAEKEIAPGSASKQVTRYFGSAVEFDLDSDGLTDSVYLLEQDNGGSGTFFYVVVALKTQDGYLGTNAIFLGDRIAPQSIAANPNNPSQLVVSYGETSTEDPMSSQPTQMVSKTFKVMDGSLVEVSPSPTP